MEGVRRGVAQDNGIIHEADFSVLCGHWGDFGLRGERRRGGVQTSSSRILICCEGSLHIPCYLLEYGSVRIFFLADDAYAGAVRFREAR